VFPLIAALMATVAAAPPSVLLVTLDTTRADRLGCYGHAPAQTPHLDALAARGLRFDRAYSTSPLTIPSHSSIFTGQVPPTHGVRDNGDFLLGDDAITLAERFQDAGYATAAFTAAFPTQAQWGLDQGFDRYHDPLTTLPQQRDWRAWRPAHEVIDDALVTLPELGGPRFVWVHLFDAHWPYEPPEPFASALEGRPYDGELAAMDHALGRLFAWWALHEPDGVVAVTADHGEALGDGGEETHGFLLVDGTLRVPLILAGPGVPRGAVASDPVSLIDLAPTLLDLAGLPGHPGLQGVDLRDGGTERPYSEALTGQFSLGLAPLRGWTDTQGRYVEGAWTSYASHGPAGIPSLAPSGHHPDHRAALAQLIDGFAAATSGRTSPDAETLAQLEALGYLGGLDLAASSDVDPRDVIGVIPLTWRVRQALGAGRPDLASAWLDTLAEPLAGTVGLTLLQGQQLRALGDTVGAASVLAELHARAPGHDVALILGGIHAELGDWHEARHWFEAALDARPHSAKAMTGAVQANLALGQLEWAWELVEAYLDVFPDHLGLVLVRAELLLAEGRAELALEDARWAQTLSPWTPGPHAVAGRALWDLGRPDAAIDALWEALAWDPRDLAVRASLAEMLLAVGRHAEAVRTLDAVEPWMPATGPARDQWRRAHDALDADRRRLDLPLLPR